MDDASLDWQPDRRSELWHNCQAYFLTGHDSCEHGRNAKTPRGSTGIEECRVQVHTFTEDGTVTLSQVDPNYSPNFSETLDNTKAKFEHIYILSLFKFDDMLRHWLKVAHRGAIKP
jgi:hypothetical protein